MNGQNHHYWRNYCPACQRPYYVFVRDMHKPKMTRFADLEGRDRHACVVGESFPQSPVPTTPTTQAALL